MRTVRGRRLVHMGLYSNGPDVNVGRHALDPSSSYIACLHFGLLQLLLALPSTAYFIDPITPSTAYSIQRAPISRLTVISPRKLARPTATHASEKMDLHGSSCCQANNELSAIAVEKSPP